MRASAVFCSLFVATALSVPLKRDFVYEDKVVYVTQYVTFPTNDATTIHHRHRHTSSIVAPPSPSTTVVPAPVKTSTKSSATPEPTSAPAPSPETSSTPEPSPIAKATSTPAPEPAPTTTPSTSGPTSGGVALIDTVNKWRGKYGLANLAWSEKLAGNAYKTGTVDDDNGRNEKHHLYDGSFAQVITPGEQPDHALISGLSAFELSYVAWLCEVSSDPQLNSDKNYCQLVSDNLHMQYSDTGHHDILNSPTYKNIGCAFAQNPDGSDPYQGLWVCDLS